VAEVERRIGHLLRRQRHYLAPEKEQVVHKRSMAANVGRESQLNMALLHTSEARPII
jgi:hypothetical protein